MKRLIALTLFLAAICPAAPKHNKKQIAVLVGTIAFSGIATYLDMRSSFAMSGKPGGIYGYPMYERSSWYASGKDHGFHARGAATMWGITGGLAVGEYMLWRQNNIFQVLPEGLSATWAVQHIRAAQRNYENLDLGKKAVGK